MNTMPQQEKILSVRELAVLKLLARGNKNGQIATALSIKERTVRFQVENILDKLSANNRTEAVCYALRKGWIND